jgi:hypothetical protein
MPDRSSADHRTRTHLTDQEHLALRQKALKEKTTVAALVTEALRIVYQGDLAGQQNSPGDEQ